MSKIGLQMYSIRTVEGNLMERLEKVAAMGFDGVEFAGFEGFTPEELKAKLDSLGMVCMGTHTPIDALRSDLDGQIAAHKTLGASYITIPGDFASLGKEMAEEERVTYWTNLAKELNEIGKTISDAGMGFCYHNHDFEFAPMGGTCPEEILFDNTDPANLKCELDTCWIENTGRKSIDFMETYKDAMELLHIKELTAVGDPTAKIIGQGYIDFPAILAKGKEVGVKLLIIEHEGLEGDILGDVKAGLDYLRSIDK